MTDLILPIGIALLCIVAYYIGYGKGKRSRKFTLDGLLPKQIFAYWIKHEIERHKKDIERGENDLRRLVNRGVKIPDLPTGLWFEVRK